MSFLKNKFWLIIVFTTLVVAALYGMPQLLIWKKLHGLDRPYKVIQLTHHSDEAYGHIPIAREIYDGHFSPGDLFFNFNSDRPSLFGPFPLPYALMAFFIYLMGGDINLAYILAHFIIPPILFLLFYFFGYVLTQKKMW
ncbi:MAG: hypothetical protein AAB725_02290 [Patescibacteria group bacterium]